MQETVENFWNGPSRYRHQKVFNRGLYICAGVLDIVKTDKAPLIYRASYFNLGGLKRCLGELNPPKPRGDGTGLST